MIDLHKHLRKYEILQTPFRPRFGYKYCGLQKAKLEDQVLNDKDTGDIIKTYDKEKNNLDSICKKHELTNSFFCVCVCVCVVQPFVICIRRSQTQNF